MPPEGHTRKQPTAPTLTASLTRKICRTCADRALRKRPPSACHRHHLDPLHRSSDFKAIKQPTEEQLGYAEKNRLPKSTPRPELLSTPSSLPNRNQRPEMAASANYTAKMPQTTRRRCRNPRGEDAAIHWSPGCGRLRDDAPKEEEDVKASSSPDLEDLRFPSGAKATGRGEEHHTTTLPRKSTTPTGVAVARSSRGRT